MAFQAAKKTMGNTHTAKGGPFNFIMLCSIVGIGTMIIIPGLRSMYLGINKYKIESD